ncbi:MAG: hypothetical protein KKA90_01995 [Nanoarchaeota archaeon]|nr:hypothetical protein [Nanoarchaeota archaeon]
MDLSTLLEFIDREHERLNDYYKHTLDSEKMLLARSVKLAEEVGELCSAVLAHKSIQRKEKLDGWDKTKLEEEVADVVFTTFLLAKALDVNIEEAMEQKIIKIDQRYER